MSLSPCNRLRLLRSADAAASYRPGILDDLEAQVIQWKEQGHEPADSGEIDCGCQQQGETQWMISVVSVVIILIVISNFAYNAAFGG